MDVDTRQLSDYRLFDFTTLRLFDYYMGMNRKDAEARIAKLREEINRYRYQYHVLDALEISEAALDALKHELYTLESEYPDLITPDSPTQRVGGAPVKGFKKVQHAERMLSLEDVFSFEELEEWLARIVKLAPSDHFDFYADPKMDGLAITLVYEDGVLQFGATRGDGRVGEDVTHNIKTVESIPFAFRKPNQKEIEGFLKTFEGQCDADLVQNLFEAPKGRFEVRGEIYMAVKQFDALNANLKKKGEAVFANPRNAAAGSIRQQDSKIAAERGLSFMSYGFLGNHGLWTTSSRYGAVKLLGFPMNQYGGYCKTLSDVKRLFEKLGQKRERLPYWIDGMVVSVNDRRLGERLGIVGKTPRSIVAWKYPAEQGTSIVRDIIVSVGRTGALTPVAMLDPVQLAGTTVQRATLHNQDEIDRLGVKIGDTVIVEKAGDVIPKIVQVLPNLRSGKERDFLMPKACPICGSAIERRKGEVAFFCTNPGCFAQERERIIHYASKAGLDIKGLGDRIVEMLIQEKLVREESDLYQVTPKELLGLEGFAELSAQKLVDEIQAHRKPPLGRFINALGIRHVGEETARDLAEHFGSFEAFRSANKEELEAIEGIGEKVADSIVAFFADAIISKRIDRLMECVEPEMAVKKKGGKLDGKVFVFTGSMDVMGRDEAKELVRSLGGDASDSVSRKTDYLVTGESTGSKLDKARKLGIEILDEKGFLGLVGRG